MAHSTNAHPSNGDIIQEITGFNRFELISDASDHYFIDSKRTKKDGVTCPIDGGTKAHKKIMQEWRILEKHLPDSIFVRAYETRIDLLRAVIIGAAGTPYHDGLYFFDFAFPSDYPTRPPCVYYRSYGIRLNPNLYAGGRVCLSLLNTWSGKKSEKWNPSQSTVLQVLLSIQALVLNEKPYFNEPGHGIMGRTIWEKKSQAYNEDVFVLSCKTMLFVLRKPPKNFEAFVLGHFRQRGWAILSACKAYVNGGVRVGYYKDDGSHSLLLVNDASEKFKGLMRQFYPQLLMAFRWAGASSVGTFVEQLEEEEEKQKTLTKSLGKAKEKKGGISKKVIVKIKKILGFEKKNKKMKGLEIKVGGIEAD